jgi:tetratricopeptide (TPR) repeat protein
MPMLEAPLPHAETLSGDLGELVVRCRELALVPLVEAVRADQAQRWRAGQRLWAEAYLEAFALLAASPEDALVLIWGEVLLRLERGEAPQPAEYGARFPRHADTLQAQFELQAHLELPSDAPTVVPGESPRAGGPPLPDVPGYELLEEIGRGGMGVVYKARQAGLDRLVALKMVLAGAYAGEAERARFRGEALAVARLQHPHVVQVFAVGEHEGHPFLALELLEGGSLAERLRGGPLPPRQAAELAERLARAVQAAHEAGVVHRDLKPANILLGGDGTAKVADFGLAKRLDAAGPTQSGAVMGTPAYMAPEQAGGRAKEVGPAADVYALGAILYEMLTGRPPFQAESPLETLQQVLTRDPVGPRRLRPQVPRDLETVCLKCLHKEPAGRYASAAALADDLRRFLDGRPVQARRVGRLGRAWRWCRRRPLVACLCVALALALLAGPVVILYVLHTTRELDRARARAAQEKGLTLYRAGDSTGAVVASTEALQLDPDLVDARLVRASAYLGLGRSDEALADSNELLRRHPDLAEGYVGRATALSSKGQYKQAVRDCTEALQQRWKYKASASIARLVRSNAYAMLGEWDLAAEDVAQAMKGQARWAAQTLAMQGGCLLAKEDRGGYHRVCRELVDRFGKSDTLDSAYLAARVSMLSSADSGIKPAVAIRLAKRALAGERTAWRLQALGLAHYRAREYKEALQWLDVADATRWAGNLSTALVQAMAHHRLGNAEEAQKRWGLATARPFPYIHPHEAVIYQILRREAEAVLKSPPGDKSS